MATVAYDPFAYAMHDDPYPTYALLRDHFPVYRNEERGFWALSRFDDVRAAARDWRSFSSHPGVDLDGTGQEYGPGNFIDLDPPRHDALRKVLRHAFVPKQVAGYEPAARAAVAEIARTLEGRSTVDLADQVAWTLPVTMICELLGVPRDDRAALRSWLDRFMFRHDGVDRLPEDAVHALGAAAGYFRALIDERRRTPRDDVATTLTRAEVDGVPLAEDEIVSICLLLLAAGVETAAGLIASAFLVLAEHPVARRRLRATPDLIPAAIEEVLRLESPIQGLARTATVDVPVHDQVIPAGARVFLLFGAANRDGRRFDDPNAFDLDREAPKSLAFGEGIHFCLGAPLARLEARVVLEQLLPPLGDYVVDGPVERLHSHTTRAAVSLPVEVDA